MKSSELTCATSASTGTPQGPVIKEIRKKKKDRRRAKKREKSSLFEAITTSAQGEENKRRTHSKF